MGISDRMGKSKIEWVKGDIKCHNIFRDTALNREQKSVELYREMCRSLEVV